MDNYKIEKVNKINYFFEYYDKIENMENLEFLLIQNKEIYYNTINELSDNKEKTVVNYIINILDKNYECSTRSFFNFLISSFKLNIYPFYLHINGIYNQKKIRFVIEENNTIVCFYDEYIKKDEDLIKYMKNINIVNKYIYGIKIINTKFSFYKCILINDKLNIIKYNYLEEYNYLIPNERKLIIEFFIYLRESIKSRITNIV